MSSTYSSSDVRQVSGQSPTEALAARYRHLFVLPSKATLMVINAAVAIVFSSAVAVGTPSPALAAVSLLAVLLVPFVIVRASKAVDSRTIATYRRSLAVTLAGTMLWLLCAGVGLACELAFHNGIALGNSLIFGAFLCGGFETLVVSGAFIDSAPFSTLLGSLQSFITGTTILLMEAAKYSALAAIPGLVAFAVLILFTVALKRKKTSGGHDAVRLFQAFMKTWANKDALELESIISSQAEKAEVKSKVLRFQSQSGDLFLVLPGVHPGPFFPVGSYNLPSLISRAFDGSGQVLTLHRPGGHERNLATNAEAKEYAQKLMEFAVGLQPSKPTTIRGPTTTKIGKATATVTGLADDLLLTVSFAPYGSDDLELDFEKRLASIAASEGYDVSVVDAHNSIESDRDRETADPNDPMWRESIQNARGLSAAEFRIGFASSLEKEFASSTDITANGIGLVLIEAQKTRWVLALADANNAVPGLRSAVSKALESSGYRLLEFCTSDSHDLAARGLTVDRGYKALGEATPVEAITNSTVGLAKIAESRLSGCGFASGTMTSEVSLFGMAALDEFAAIARESSAFSKNYAKFGSFGLALLLLLSLVI